MGDVNEREETSEKRTFPGRLYAGCILLALLLEVIVFQFRYWTGQQMTMIEVPLDVVLYQGDYGIAEDGTMILQEANGQNLLQLDLRGLQVPVRNIEIQAVCTDGHEIWQNRSREPYAELESEAVWAQAVQTAGDTNRLLAAKMLGAGQEDVIWFASGQPAEYVTVLLSGVKGHRIQLSRITLNVPTAFRFRFGRFAVVLLCLLFLAAFRPGSVLWKTPALTAQKKWQPKLCIGLGIGLVMLAFLIPLLIRQNPVYLQSEGGFPFYRQLAHALASGHTYIDLQPSPELLAMEDPYDPVARLEQEVSFYLDYAFYEGRYYVYFGIVPCLLFYLPLYLITGIDVPGWIVLSGLLFLICLGQLVLLKKICERYAPKVSQACFVLLWLAGVAVMSLPQAMGDANNYYISQLSAIVLFQFGYAGCLAAVQRMEEGKKAGLLLTVSALALAGIAGCRPQMVLAAATVIPLLWPYLIGKKAEDRKKQVGYLTCFLAPFVVVAIGLMAYNIVRFESPVDFGTGYNLTFAYVSTGGVYAESIVNGLYYYLVRPFRLGGLYPYLQRNGLDWSNPAGLANHPSVGGLYLLYPVLFLGGGIFAEKKKNKTENRELQHTGYILLTLVVVMPVLDAVMGGLMDRYKLDFAVFAAFAMSIGVLVMAQGIGEKRKSKAQLFLVLLTAGAMIVSALSYGMEGVSLLQQVNPEAYATISGAIEFWR